jgi:hypothetical protein
MISTITRWEGGKVPKFDRGDIYTSTGAGYPISDNQPAIIG